MLTARFASCLVMFAALLAGRVFATSPMSFPSDDELANFVPSTAGVGQENLLVGYFEQWAVFGPNVHIQDLPLDRLTHLIYESAGIGADGSVVIGQPVADIYFQYPEDDMSKQKFAGSFHAMVKAKKRHPGLKTLLTVGDWDRSQYFSRVLADATLRDNAIRSVTDTMLRYHFDGVDIYWLFPVKHSEVEDSFRPEDPQNYLAFLKRLRYAFDALEKQTGQHYLLTTTVDYVVVDNLHVVAAATPYLDFINLDTSQFNGSWSKATDHLSPLYRNEASENYGSVDEMVNLLAQHGAAKSKIVINIPAFSQGWQNLQDNGSNGLFVPFKEISWGSWETDENQVLGMYSRDDLRKFKSMPGYQQHWDNIAKASYLYSPERFNGHFISFESERAIEVKFAYIEQHGLAGIGLRSLHNDDYKGIPLVSKLYRHINPLHAKWLDTRDFILRHLHIILIATAITLLIIIFFVVLQYRQHKQIRSELVENKRFENMTFQLQLMEWALIQLRQLWLVHQNQAVRLQIDNLPELNAQVAMLLKPVTFLLHETKLGLTPRHSEMRNVNLLEISHHLRTMLATHPSVKPENVRLHIDEPTTLYVDPNYLLQMILSIFYLILENMPSDDCITIRAESIGPGAVHFLISNSSGNFAGFRNQDFLRLKDIYRTAHQLGVELQHQAEGTAKFAFAVTKVQNAAPTALGQWLEEKQEEIAEKPKLEELSQGQISDISYLDFLEKFTQEESTSDMSKLIERACRYFSVSIAKPLKFSIFQGEQLIILIDNLESAESSSHKTDYESGELHFQIESTEPLTPTDIRYFSVLINQIQLVRQTLKEMVKEPVLLSELYELSKNKDRISYVQADQGYTTVYFMGRKNTQCLSSRLRTIKQYFDDDALLQVHRSYLVNPKRVEKVVKKTKYKYEIAIQDKSLPISRTYLPILKEQFPHWF